MEPIVHLSPSNLNAWEELRKANDESPPWVTPENFKNSILRRFEPSLAASAGNAVHEFVFGGTQDFQELDWKFRVGDAFVRFREMFPFGTGVAEVPKVKYLSDRVEGHLVRVSERLDYVSRNLITEMKTSSRTFRKKGVTRSYLESQQSFSYTWTYGIPIRFLFAEIAIKNIDGVHNISLKDASCSTAYPSSDSDRRLIECVSSLIPYLKSDEEMWHMVTNRKLPDEF